MRTEVKYHLLAVWTMAVFASATWLSTAAKAGEDGLRANPALERFSDRVLFLASFDQMETTAELAAGNYNPRAVSGEATFADGLFGKALASGQIVYHAGQNIDTTAPGALLFWWSPTDWQPADSEPYIWPLQVVGKGFGFLMGRQGKLTTPKRRATVYFHVSVSGEKGVGAHRGGGGADDWENGSWHLIVINWSPNRMEMSLDGAAAIAAAIGSFNEAEWFRVGVPSHSENHGFLIDELMVLDRNLTAEEIAWIYEKSLESRLQ